jgi:phosphatidylglycerophosphate synthase
MSVSSHGSDHILRVEGRGNGTLAVADIAAPSENRLGRIGAAPALDNLEPVTLPQKRKRVNASFIGSLEARVIAAVLPNIPESVSPNELTMLGLFGAFITSFGLIACVWSPKAVILVPVGLFVHWFGDSFDGSLARYRKIERPSFGFFIDHSSDLFAMSIIIVSFGLSPFLTMTSALLVLTTYLLFSAYTYVKVAVEGVHQLAYGGMGSTEFRLLMAGWAIAGTVVGPSILGGRVLGVYTIDVVIGSLTGCAYCGLAGVMWRDAARIARIERRQSRFD